jgi:general secretion pathway protein A
MYESFYGFRERPFDLTPNPRFLLLTGHHREALSNLQYGISSRRALTLLVGEVGTGKTTLVRAAVEDFERQGHCMAYLNNPTLTRAEFCEFLASAFSLSVGAASSKARLLAELAERLQEQRSQQHISALIIDEAQSLPNELLEEIRLLANIETATEKLLPVVLSGQPELAGRLNAPQLRQLKQRVALRCTLEPLDARETAEYVAGRIRIAGGNSALVFTRQAIDVIYRHSGGIPRLISVICDNALISGFAADCRPVNRQIVEEVCKDFDLRRATDAQNEGLLGGPTAKANPSPAPAEPATRLQESNPGAERDSASRGLFQHFSVRRRFSFFS